MITPFKKKKHLLGLLDFVLSNKCLDFYITINNERRIINSFSLLRKLLKSANKILISEDNGRVNGILIIWKSFGGNLIRNYIKLNTIDESTADKLLSVLLWNWSIKKDLFIKVNKRCSFLNILRDKGFCFYRGRGREFLLRRMNNEYIVNYRNKSQATNRR